MEDVFCVRNDIEDARREVHHAKAMFKPFVGCTGIDEVSHSKLMHVAEPLEGSGVDYSSLIRPNRYERVNRVPKFMAVLHHAPTRRPNHRLPIMAGVL